MAKQKNHYRLFWIDILIALNAKKNNLEILTFDKHFALMQDSIGFSIYK